MKTNSRMSMGIGVAVALAVAGPTFLAVGAHTGNQSGNEPVAVDGSLSVQRDADATWTPADGVRRYSFSVVEHSDVAVHGGTIDQSATREVTGEAIARTELCDEQGECALENEWRAPLGSPITEGPWIRMDPVLQAARFRGWLRVDGTGPACLFEVEWSAGASLPGVQPSASGTFDPESLGGIVPKFPEQEGFPVPDVVAPEGALFHESLVSMSRPATAAVTASCWSADGGGDFASGVGTLKQDVATEGLAVVQGLSTEHVLD